ncbi:hypothetical protein CEXT_57951 [Caerostris extrusa]|uniref:Uncharacterized protein n=1 Tax=Caerostris extrusa TaxID=172846 RepID=A0AAV4QWM9_CAEEX|nr:hypothetical protein CEXT_57951 [Caerostris extrusa]
MLLLEEWLSGITIKIIVSMYEFYFEISSINRDRKKGNFSKLPKRKALYAAADFLPHNNSGRVDTVVLTAAPSTPYLVEIENDGEQTLPLTRPFQFSEVTPSGCQGWPSDEWWIENASIGFEKDLNGFQSKSCHNCKFFKTLTFNIE